MPTEDIDDEASGDEYQRLLQSIRLGLSTQAPVSRCTRSHVALASPSPSAASSSSDESDAGDAASPRSEQSASSSGRGTHAIIANSSGVGEKLRASAASASTLRRRAVTIVAPQEGESDPGQSGDEADAADTWRFGEWRPDMEMPAAATVASAARQETELAAPMLPGACKLQRAAVRDVRREARAAARAKDAGAGRGWFDMKAQTITPEVKRDWRLLRLRAAYDPRHFYKGFDSTRIPKHFEMGTVIEGTGEFYSGRLTKRERKQTFTEEILADVKVKKERKRRYDKMQAEREELARKRKKARAHHKRSAHRPKH